MAQTQMQIQKDERSLGELFSELAADTGTLVRQEVALAQTELTAKAAHSACLLHFPWSKRGVHDDMRDPPT